MGYNPAINIFRRLTPHLRVKGEHPLKCRDLRLIRSFFQETDFKFFHLLSLLAIPFKNTAIFSYLLKLLDYFDGKLLEFVPPIRLLFWQVVIVLKNLNKPQI